MITQPTRDQLLEAMRLSGLRMTLEAAMQSRALAIALANTAVAHARRAATQPKRQTIDHKRLAAGDND